MTTSAKTLERRFRFGVTTLADPDPAMLPLDAMRLHSRSYPFLASATLGEPVVEGDFLVYPVLKPAVQTKGASRKKATQAGPSLDQIMQWGMETAQHDDEQPARWQAVASLVHQRATAATNPIIDSFLIPLA